MKILFITVKELGGANASMVQSICQIRDKGITPVVVTTDRSAFGYFESYGIKCYAVNMILSIWPNNKGIKNKLLFVPRLIKMIIVNAVAPLYITRIINKEHPDIIHTNISLLNAGYWAAKKYGIPHVWHIREYVDYDFGYRHFPSKRKKYALIQSTPSVSITKDVYKYFQVGDNGQFIYDGVLSAKYSIEKDAVNNRGKYFLFVGSVIDGKGCTDLVNGFCKFAAKHKDIQLFIAGKGKSEYISELKRIAEKKNCLDRIEFLGRRTDAYLLMSKAECLIVPSRYEGFGRITAEAMFNDCIVIGNDTAGTKEQFDNGIELTGQEIGIRYGGSVSLANAMERFMQMGEDEKTSMRSRASMVVRQLYSVEANGEKMFRFYNSII